ncbi:MAG: hypothetical protein WCT50_01950 [Patescibacteria group bacterium]
MNTVNNVEFKLIKAMIVERIKNGESLFGKALQKLINSTEEELDDFLKRRIAAKVAGEILRLISINGTLTLRALDGSRLIYNAEKTFVQCIDQDFVKWGTNNPGIPTLETLVQVHEMIKKGTALDIFSALPGNWNEKWLSQNQVIEFCEVYPDWLRQNGNGTFFLIKKDESAPVSIIKPENDFIVAGVYVYSGGLRIGAEPLRHGNVWHGEYNYRVVSPEHILSV